jgi:hypothetical protein
MTWTKVGDDWCDRPDLLAVSRSTRLLALEALVWSNRHLVDGMVPRTALRRLTDHEDPIAAAAELVAAGVWAETDGGWQIDVSDQATAADVRHQQALRRERQARWLAGKRNASRDASSAASKDMPQPSPAPPSKGGDGAGLAARSAGATRTAGPDGSVVFTVGGR